MSAPSATTVPVTVTPVLDVTSLTVLLAPYNFTVSLLVTSIPASLPTPLMWTVPLVFKIEISPVELAIYEWPLVWWSCKSWLFPICNFLPSINLTLSEKVDTPATLTLSKFVWPSTSKSCDMVVTPAMLTLSKFVWPSTSKSPSVSYTHLTLPTKRIV